MASMPKLSFFAFYLFHWVKCLVTAHLSCCMVYLYLFHFEIVHERKWITGQEWICSHFILYYLHIYLSFWNLLMCLQWQVRYQTYGQMISTKRKNDKPEKGLTWNYQIGGFESLTLVLLQRHFSYTSFLKISHEF